MSTSFTNKHRQIEVDFKNARQNQGLMSDARAYLLNEESHEYQMRDKSWPDPNNHFSNAEEKALAVGPNVFLLGNKQSFSEGQYPKEPRTPGMSMVHIFAISKVSYFNPVSMGPDEAQTFLDMIDFFKLQWELSGFRMSVLEHQKKAIEERSKTTKVGLDKARDQVKELESTIHKLKFEDFAFGFHLWPDNSVPHLHMHIIAMPDEYRQHSTKFNDKKTKDAYEVYRYICDHQ
ncbi:hypothetical protein ABKA04_005953 [Annulohypoxylon sp. FPYF3050]